MKRTYSFMLILLVCLLLATSCAPSTPPQTQTPDAPVSGEAVGVPEPDPTPDAPVQDSGPKRVSFLATGDNLIHTGIWRQANRNAGGSGNECTMDSPYDFAPFYQSLVPLLEKADLAMLNQETLVDADEEGPSNYPAFNSPRACGDTMVELGFNIVNMANNHMLDKASSGLASSISYWEEKEGVMRIGAYRDEADFNSVRVVEKNGLRIAFLSYAEDPNNSGLGTKYETENYLSYGDLGLYIPHINEQILRSQVQAAKELADFVVVAMHWGTENTTKISENQETYAAICAELGVDVVVGSHPHVIQKMEWRDSTATSGRTLVVYSLGNMISLMESTGANMLGGALSLDFVKTGDMTTVENVVFTPIVTHCSADYRDIRVCLLSEYTAQDYAGHCIHRYCDTSFSDFASIMKSQIPSEFWGGADYS